MQLGALDALAAFLRPGRHAVEKLQTCADASSMQSSLRRTFRGCAMLDYRCTVASSSCALCSQCPRLHPLQGGQRAATVWSPLTSPGSRAMALAACMSMTLAWWLAVEVALSGTPIMPVMSPRREMLIAVPGSRCCRHSRRWSCCRGHGRLRAGLFRWCTVVMRAGSMDLRRNDYEYGSGVPLDLGTIELAAFRDVGFTCDATAVLARGCAWVRRAM